MTSAAWTTLADADAGVPDELVALAERCLRADGGLPLAAEPWFLRRRWAAPGRRTFALRADGGGAGPAGGALLAAGVACPAGGGVTVTGLVAPEVRGRGLGARLLDHGLALAAELRLAPDRPAGTSGGPTAAAPAITVETESLTEAAEALFASRGLQQFFAEDVMRIELNRPAASGPGPAAAGLSGSAASDPGPAVTSPNRPTASDPALSRPATAGIGLTLTEWSAATAARFHATYAASFRDRPGFPGDPADVWIAENEEDDDFRPAWSLLATVPALAEGGSAAEDAPAGDAGFVTAAVGWIVQVGVIPAARGRGIGAALVRESLARMAAAGRPEAWLTVNTNNPGAAALYRKLGFHHRGRRARYRTKTELAS